MEISSKWSKIQSALEDFGGKEICLSVPKTGLPYFDTLRLYGAVEIFIGLNPKVIIRDKGVAWEVESISRKNYSEALNSFLSLLTDKLSQKQKKQSENMIPKLVNAILEYKEYPVDILIQPKVPFETPDSGVQKGIRDISVSSYNKFSDGISIKIPLSDAVLAFAGQKRVGQVGQINFLPVFEGTIDYAKVISPLRIYSPSPNPIHKQVYQILALKSSLFAEGYENRLSAVVYDTSTPKSSLNWSGIINIDSTALKRHGLSSETTLNLYESYVSILKKAYQGNKATSFYLPTNHMANWVLNPSHKNLHLLILSQEIKARDISLSSTLFSSHKIVKEIFDMTQKNDWMGNHEAVQKFAKAIASAIYNARQKDKTSSEEKRKAWYDEVVMLRSSTNAKMFKQRVLILLEQGHKENDAIGTSHRNEDFDPISLLNSMGNDRNEFEQFRDLFRMYLIQASTYKKDNNE